MNRDQFEDYLQVFNARDYDRLHREYFAPDMQLVTLGYVLEGEASVRRFYSFFHRHVKESIRLIEFFPLGENFFAHLGMRLEAVRALTREALESQGLGRLPAIPAGSSFENEMFVHYLVRNGRFRLVRCAVYDPPADRFPARANAVR